ncbi:MAG TPA: 16S rRNA (uracil(1498)-N(3))-methyltransferase, partial [Acidimicrobiia bacterium]|nr:16S rRNA (uracil(1498)-N(3))-methyltransferase [Acidimicrobiia bacterium]
VADVGALADRPDLLVADRAGAPVGSVALPGSGSWTVVVGPEGGFGPDDLVVLAGASRVSVGPFVLRGGTAPIALAAALLARAS